METSDRGLIKEFHATLAFVSKGDTACLEKEIKQYRETLNGRPSSPDLLTKQKVIMNDPVLPDWLRRVLKAIGLVIPLLALLFEIDPEQVGELFANLATWGSLTIVMFNEVIQFFRGLSKNKAKYLKWSTKR